MVYSHKQRLCPFLNCYTLLLFLICQQMTLHPSGQTSISIDLGSNITRMTFTTDFSYLYVGGVNFVAQLTLNLDLLSNITIGPVKNAEHCAPNPAPCDNTVTVLEINGAHNMLLVCGSAYRGTCTLHNLTTILQWSCLYAESGSDSADVISGNHHQTAVVHFLSRTLVKSNRNIQQSQSFNPPNNCRPAEFGSKIMGSYDSIQKYAGTQSDRAANSGSRRLIRSTRTRQRSNIMAQMQMNGNVGNDSHETYRRSAQSQNDVVIDQANLMVAGSVYNGKTPLNPPLVSLRRISFVGPHYTIGYERAPDSSPVGFQMASATPASMIPEYKFSFAIEGYSYFLFLQESKECEKPGPCIVTKMSRTCNDPSSIWPYVETTLSCENAKDKKKYHLLTSAAVATVGLQTSNTYVTYPVLVMAFGNGSDPLSRTADSNYGTTVCAVSLEYLNELEFGYVLKQCGVFVNVDLARHASWISGKEEQCQMEISAQRTNCSSNVKNKYIQNTGLSEFTTDTYIASLSVVHILTIHRHASIETTGAFLLTNDGKLKKVSLTVKKDIGKKLEAEIKLHTTESFDLNETISSPPLGITDHARAVMYVANGHKIVELDIDVCLKFQSCSDCKAKAACQWCSKNNECLEKELSFFTCKGEIESNCPPVIIDFNPKMVPMEGGSVLTLSGSQLGITHPGAQASTQAVQSVTIQVCDQPCDEVRANNNEATCKLRKCNSCAKKCNITVTVKGQLNSDGTTTSYNMPKHQVLEYVNPNITTFRPIHGPAHGGTVIKFQGQNMKVGTKTIITVGNASCIVTRNTTDLSCKITEDRNRTTGKGIINISIDNFNTTLSTEQFEFRPNPKIDSMKPMMTIVSGGVTVTVEGTYLNSAASHFFRLILPNGNTKDNVFNGSCTVLDGKKMTCITPKNIPKQFIDNKNNLASVVLEMDGIDLMKQLPKLEGMRINQDPEIHAKDERYIGIGATTFVITGEKIPSWINYSDIVVTIDNVTLDIIDVREDQITCDAKKAIDMYHDYLQTEISQTTRESHNTKTTNIYRSTTKTTTVNRTHVTSRTTAGPTMKVTTGTLFQNSTRTLRRPRELLFPQSVFKNASSGAYGASSNTSIIATTTYITEQNETHMLTMTGNNFSISNTSKIIKCTVRIQIGNYKKDLGYVIIGPKGDSNIDSSTKGQYNHGDQTDHDLALITGGSGAGVVFLVLLVVSCVMYIRAKRARALVKEHAFFMSSLSGSQHGSKEGALPSLKQILQSVMEPEKRADLDRLIISLDRLTVGKSIGSGNFGCVFEGFLSMDKETQAQKVAVKTLQDPSSHNLDLHAFVQEAVIMREFQHQHVLGLIGLAEKEPGIPYVILPYMDNGDLLSFIRDTSVSISLHDVIKFGADIASGMAYLATLKFVHRDLAARNCMLDDEYRVKVADFGLCRDVYEKGYYTSDNRKKLPIRWMAVESIDHGEYSSKSDVWSLGVVLWELLSRGVTPYPGVNGWDIINFLRHRRLAPPHFCPDEMYDLMMQCWAKDLNHRPDFITIQTRLLAMIGQSPALTDTIKRRRGDNVPAYNNLLVNDKSEPKKDGKNVKTGPSMNEKRNSPDVKGQINTVENNILDPISRKDKHYTNLSEHNVALNNVLITIPICYSHRDVSKTAAGIYIQLVDDYEPPPKFSNILLRSMKKHSKKTHDRHTKGVKRNEDAKTNSSGYSFPGEYPAVEGSISGIGKDCNDGQSQISEANVTNRGNKEKSYYELEPTSLRSSATSESRSGWSTLNNTGSSASVLDVQSRDSSASNGCASGSSSLTVPQSHSLPCSSIRSVVVNKIPPEKVPRKLIKK